VNAPAGIKVFIRNLAGDYLASSGDDWAFICPFK
jgi:hypothetical protein